MSVVMEIASRLTMSATIFSTVAMQVTKRTARRPILSTPTTRLSYQHVAPTPLV